MRVRWQLFPLLAFLALITLTVGCSEQKGNTARFDKSFGILIPGNPTIGNVTPSEGPDIGGTTVIVEGTGFRSDSQVYFDGVPATQVTYISASQLRVITPPGKEGPADVTVENKTGAVVTLTGGFNYVNFLVDPNAGDPAGSTLVSIQGANFAPGMQVLFGGAAATNVSVSGTTNLQCTTPQSPLGGGGGPGVVDVTLNYPNGDTVILPQAYSYSPWTFETPDNAATNVQAIGAKADGSVVLAVGEKGLVNLNSTGEWQYIVLKDSSGAELTIPTDSSSEIPDFFGVWVGVDQSSSNDVAFIVGEEGIILRRVSTNSDWSRDWEVVRNPSTTFDDINDVHALSAPSGITAFAAADDGKIHISTDNFSSLANTYDNSTTPSTGTTSNFYAVFAHSVDDVFFAGSSGNLVHYDHNSTTFTTQSIDSAIGTSPYSSTKYYPTLWSIKAFELTGGGGRPVVYLCGASSYNPSNSSAATIIRGVVSSGNTYSWSRMDVGDARYSLYALWGSSEEEVYATGSRANILKLDYDSSNPSQSAWSLMPSGSKYLHPSTSQTWAYFAMWGYANTSNKAQEIWVGGTRGRIMHHQPPRNAPDPHMWFTETLTGVGTNVIRDIHGNAWNNVWAVGDNGTVFHGSNTATNNAINWTARNVSGGTVQLKGVWTAGPETVYAVGHDGSADEKGIIYFYDGTTWQTNSSNPRVLLLSDPNSSLNDVWGFGPQEIYACGNGGRVYKFDGNSWSQVAQGVVTEDLLGIYANQSSSGYTKRVVAVGKAGTGLYSSGTTWNQATTGTTEDLYAIDGSSAYTMYAVGDKGEVRKFSSYGTWRKQTMPSAVASTNFRSVYVNDVDDIYVGGAGGELARYSGYPVSDWEVLNSPTSEGINAIFGADANEMFMSIDSSSGADRVFRGHSHWVVQVVRTLTIRNYYFALMVPQSGGKVDIWVGASDGSSARRRDNQWQRFETGTSRALYAMFTPNDSDIYAVGSRGTILKYTGGTSWNVHNSGVTSTLYWVWGPSATEIYAVGTSRTLLQNDGSSTSWNQDTITSNPNNPGYTYDWLVWAGGSGANDMWVIGDRTALHNTGTDWDPEGTNDGWDPNRWISMVWRNPTNGNLYCVGYSGQTAIYNNSSGTWTMYRGTSSFVPSGNAGPSGTLTNLWWVWGKDDNNVWAVGSSGTIVKWDGTGWSAVSSGTNASLNCVWGDVNGATGKYEFYACGRDGTLLKYDYDNPSAGWVQEPISTDLDFFYVTGEGNRVIVTSEFGTVLVK